MAEHRTYDDDLMSRAQQDMKAYIHAMMQPNGWRVALRIEEDWALDGYSPAVVSEVLSEVANGKSFDEALTYALGIEE